MGRFLFSRGIRPTKVASLPFIGGYLAILMLKGTLSFPENELKILKEFVVRVSKQQNVSEGGFYTLMKWPCNPVCKTI